MTENEYWYAVGTGMAIVISLYFLLQTLLTIIKMVDTGKRINRDIEEGKEPEVGAKYHLRRSLNGRELFTDLIGDDLGAGATVKAIREGKVLYCIGYDVPPFNNEVCSVKEFLRMYKKLESI